MKHIIIAIAVGMSALLITPACAGNEEIVAKLAEASSPANVKAVALQQKRLYCDQNAKNKALQGSEKESYLTACMNSNEALSQFALVNRGAASTDAYVASTEFNNSLQQSPNSAGAK